MHGLTKGHQMVGEIETRLQHDTSLNVIRFLDLFNDVLLSTQIIWTIFQNFLMLKL